MDAEESSLRSSKKEIFWNALEQASPDERAAYLDSVCGSDVHLREEVEALIRNHKAGDLLDQYIPKGQRIEMHSREVGDFIDDYELIGKVGDGGFGAVFRAKQRKPFERTVAFKLIKLALPNTLALNLFKTEIQALAKLDHSNIARVYDAGETSQKQPYIVMELVEGIAITNFADTNQLTIHDRLAMFVKVCEAIDYAHLEGIIHQDVKPANILVARENGQPWPKVIDFGISKPTVGEQSPNSSGAVEGRLIGTPNYMSPEQVDGLGIEVDRRTDIYSLGVLLYELVAGNLPLNLDKRGRAEMVQTILNEIPIQPSIFAAELPEKEVLRISQARQVIPSELIKQLKTLDPIVMKCLAKDRDHRFETAGAIAKEIERVIGVETPKGSNRFIYLCVALLFAILASLYFHQEKPRATTETLNNEDFVTADQITLQTIKAVNSLKQ